MPVPSFDDRPPASDKLTDYDERHLVTYLRLLDAALEGADWREVANVVFGIDASRNEERAKIVYDNHLARGQWLAKSGYINLLRSL
jgi:hypothetical protein